LTADDGQTGRDQLGTRPAAAASLAQALPPYGDVGDLGRVRLCLDQLAQCRARTLRNVVGNLATIVQR